jgi:hypothetical protein
LRPENRVVQKPSARKAKEVIPFRCPPDLAKWLEERTDPRGGVKRTDAVIWALEHGRTFVEATKELDPRIQALLASSGLTELALLKRILAAGLPVVEKELGPGR